jgi:protein CWC15
VKKRDLRTELLAAEAEARNKKRKAEGKPPLPIEGSSSSAGATPASNGAVSMQVDNGDEEANKRRKLLQEAMELDRDDDADESGEENGSENGEGGAKNKADKSDDDLYVCFF